LPQPQLDRENTAGRRVGARSVNNKIQKRAVNPLTRHASRSVMGSNYQSPQVEGPAGDIWSIARPNCTWNCRSVWRFSARDQQVGPTTSGIA